MDAESYHDYFKNDHDSSKLCVVDRCNSLAEYQCKICIKKYCDTHIRMHGHLEGHEDLK
jgi:hypothetical protein